MAESGRCIEDSALYLVEDRIKTFESSSWPFDSGPCTPAKVSPQGVRVYTIYTVYMYGSYDMI